MVLVGVNANCLYRLANSCSHLASGARFFNQIWFCEIGPWTRPALLKCDLQAGLQNVRNAVQSLTKSSLIDYPLGRGTARYIQKAGDRLEDDLGRLPKLALQAIGRGDADDLGPLTWSALIDLLMDCFEYERWVPNIYSGWLQEVEYRVGELVRFDQGSKSDTANPIADPRVVLRGMLEHQIYELLEAGRSLTLQRIADALDKNIDNGTLRRTVADMRKRGILVNHGGRTGYSRNPLVHVVEAIAQDR